MTYSYKMPDLEELMQVWPDEMEAALGSLPLPTADLDLSLDEYTKVICALLDIPVKGNLIESLHVLFTLFQMFKDIGCFPGGSRSGTPSLGR
jgi:intraflagellar transport protein 46